MKIYLDMCCFNRPYDDQSQLRISLESQAKIYIQEKIREGEFELVTSYTLQYENSQNKEPMRRKSIEEFAHRYLTTHIGIEYSNEISRIAQEVMVTGIKEKDAYHVASAIVGKCEYFITTDDRILKYKSKDISIVNPVDFIRLEGEEKDE